jgi:para-aminobenzoate synthetase component 1
MSIYTSAEKVKELINNASALSKPFLFAVDFELNRALFIEDPINQSDILFRVGEVKNYKELSFTKDEKYLQVIEPISYSQYIRQFDKVKNALLMGDTYLTNLTAPTKIGLSLTLKDILVHTKSKFGLCVNDDFVSFSPERFVRIDKGFISSSPMKGTIDASVLNAEEVIMNDYKEICEHNTIVDLIRNDIGKIADKVWIEKFRYLDLIKSDRRELLQVSSEIRGLLPNDYQKRLGDIIFSLLPAGSVSGAPKVSTIRLISETEDGPRGFYTGIFGYFDGFTFDSAVLIRYIERVKDGTFIYRSGGGLTVNSNPEDEYKELIEKVYLPI